MYADRFLIYQSFIQVRYGEDLVGDKYDSNKPNPIVRPGPTPLDKCGAASGASGKSSNWSFSMYLY
jgi:hypothetical protein